MLLKLFIKKLNFLKDNRGIAPLFILVLVAAAALAIPVTTKLVQQPQDLRQRAEGLTKWDASKYECFDNNKAIRANSGIREEVDRCDSNSICMSKDGFVSCVTKDEYCLNSKNCDPSICFKYRGYKDDPGFGVNTPFCRGKNNVGETCGANDIYCYTEQLCYSDNWPKDVTPYCASPNLHKEGETCQFSNDKCEQGLFCKSGICTKCYPGACDPTSTPGAPTPTSAASPSPTPAPGNTDTCSADYPTGKYECLLSCAGKTRYKSGNGDDLCPNNGMCCFTENPPVGAKPNVTPAPTVSVAPTKSPGGGTPPPPSSAKVDLAITGINIKNAPNNVAQPGQNVTVEVSLVNNGPGSITPSNNIKIYFYRNAPISSLTAGNSTGNIPLDVTLTSGGPPVTKTFDFPAPLQENTSSDPSYNLAVIADPDKVAIPGDTNFSNNRSDKPYTVKAASSAGGGVCSAPDIGKGRATCNSGYTCEKKSTGEPECQLQSGICSTAGGRISMSEGCNGTKWYKTWLCANGSQESSEDPSQSSKCTAALTPSPGAAQCYKDTDGDGYGDANAPRVNCGTPNSVAQAGDCNDNNPDVHKYQTKYFQQPASGGTKPFDYDCNGTEEGVYKVSSLPSSSTACLTTTPGGVVGLNNATDETKCGQPVDFRVCFVFESQATCQAGVGSSAGVSDKNNTPCPAGGASSAWMVRSVKDYGGTVGTIQWCR